MFESNTPFTAAHDLIQKTYGPRDGQKHVLCMVSSCNTEPASVRQVPETRVGGTSWGRRIRTWRDTPAQMLINGWGVARRAES